MSHQLTITNIRLNDIIACLTPAVALLDKVNGAFDTPFIQAISNTALALITALQNVKRNKDECIQLMENIHHILYALINLQIKSETAGSLPPATLYHVGKFTETLHRIHTFFEAQQDGNKIKQFFRQSEMNTLCKGCQAGLDEALQVFKVETSLLSATNIAELQKKRQDIHQELLDLVEDLSDGSNSDRLSFVYDSSHSSSNSFSLLPALPKIFCGRHSELEDIITSLTQQSAHIAILGPGGIGKTSLAKAALHHPHIAAKYQDRFFISTESTTTSIGLAALIGSHLGLKAGKNLTKPVLRNLSAGPPCLLVLDNLETPWEPMQSRSGVEEFLSLLTDITHLALIVTMRGAERPAKVRWTRPFLEPLKPLSYEAARQTFIEIADDCHDSRDIDQLLHLTDYMPLAVNLIAHLVDYEGCPNILARWETEKTSLLSAGFDNRLNLDASIEMSLESPRMVSSPGAKNLLSLLSILPDGLSDIELLQCTLPIQDIMGCRATLLCTSLAYYDDKKRLKSLAPIRQHIQDFHPPSQPLFHPLCKYFHLLMDLFEKYRGLDQNHPRINQITSNLGNLQQLLLLELHPENPDLEDAINCTLSLNSFHRLTGHGRTALMDCLPTVFSQPQDHQIEAKFIREVLSTVSYHPIANPELLIHQGLSHFNHFDNPVFEARFYVSVGHYYQFHKDMPTSAQYLEKALSLAKSCGDSRQQAIAHERIAWLKYNLADYSAAQLHAHEAQRGAQLSGNLHGEARALRADALCLIALGNLKESVFLYQRARELLQLCGLQRSRMAHTVMFDLAEVHLQKSEYIEARKIHVELVQKVASIQQDPYHQAFVLLNLAEIDIIIGADAHDVQQNLDNAKTKFSNLGVIRAVNQCEMVLADLNLREGNTRVAKDVLQQCLKTAWRNDSQAMSYCLERLGNIGRWTSTGINWPHIWTVIYLIQAHKSKEKLALHKALCFMGNVFLSKEDEHTAHTLFAVALEGFTYMDIHRSRADCMLRLGDIAKHRGDLVKAVKLWTEARPLFERSSQAKEIAEIDTRFAAVDRDVLDTPLHI
ncbi:hypothetical protein C8R44DRAFT_853775 [Mycena epipterygia]|nr:hypothetical protein C8R44DRAFT_853775 [Mycena epipterygia]